MDDRPSTLTESSQELQRRAVRGSILSLANQGIKTTVNLAAPVVLAVYLGPHNFGVVGIAFAVQSLIMVLRDGGLANALIQKQALADRHLNSVFWLSALAGAVLSIILALLAVPLARFFEEPLMAPIVWLMVLPIMAQALSSVPEARFRKEVRFGAIMLADSGSVVVASAAAVVAVILGAGIWALVLRMIATPVLLAIGCWLLTPWRPRREFSMSALRSLWSFGGYLLLTMLLGFAMTQLDVPIVSKRLGMEAAGVFFMAGRLALNPIRQIVGAVAYVMFPVFSAIQDDPGTIRSGFLTGTRCLATLIFPLIAGLIALSPDLIRVMLGERWLGAVPLVQIIAWQGFPICINAPAAQVLYARGRSRLQLIYSAVIAVLVLTSLVVGCQWGPVGVAITWTAVRLCASPTVLWFAAREMALPIRIVLANVARPALAALVAGGAARILAWSWHRAGYPAGYALLGTELLVGFAVYAWLCVWLLKDTLHKMKADFLAATPGMRPR